LSFKGRGAVIDRAFKTIKALKNPITTQQLADILETNRSSAYYYIQAASIHFPVIGINEETRAFKEPIIYQLMEE